MEFDSPEEAYDFVSKDCASPAIRLARDHRDLGHGRFGIGKQSIE